MKKMTVAIAMAVFMAAGFWLTPLSGGGATIPVISGR
jgi:hypothetical protein